MFYSAYLKKISDTSVRLGEVRFCFANVFTPKENDDGKKKYSVQILIPKGDVKGIEAINACIEAAKQNGASSKWGGKIPPASKLHLPLRDGDEEFPDDETYKGMWFMNASSPEDHAPGVRVLENGHISEALDADDFYSGCYGAVTVGFFPYSASGNTGVAAGLNNVIKTRDGQKMSGGRSAEEDFNDMAGASALD